MNDALSLNRTCLASARVWSAPSRLSLPDRIANSIQLNHHQTMNRIRKLVTSRHYDMFLLVALLVLAGTAFAFYDFLHRSSQTMLAEQTVLFWMLATGCLTGIGLSIGSSIAGLGKLSWAKCGLLVLLLATCWGLLWCICDSGDDSQEFSRFTNYGSVVFVGVIAALAFLFGLIWRTLTRKFSLELLVGLATVLFVVLYIVFEYPDLAYIAGHEADESEIFWVRAAAVMAGVAFCLWSAGHGILKTKNWIALLFVCVYLGIAFFVAPAFASEMKGGEQQAVIYAILFVAPMSLLTMKSLMISRELPATQSSWSPSLLSYVLGTGCLICTIFPLAVFFQGAKGPEKDDGLYSANELPVFGSWFSTKGARMGLTDVSNLFDTETIRCAFELEQDAAPDCLQLLIENVTNDNIFLTIDGATPTLDTSLVRNLKKNLSIANSTLTKQQLADLLNNATGNISLIDVNLIDNEKTLEPASHDCEWINYFAADGTGHLKPLFEAVGSRQSGPFSVHVSGEISLEDWQAALSASETFSVNVSSELPVGAKVDDIKPHHKLIYQDPDSLTESPPLTEDELADFPFDSPQEYWDSRFSNLGHVEESAGLFGPVRDARQAFGTDYTDLNQLLTDFHLAYGHDADGNITELFVPLVSVEFPEIGKLTKIQSLSFATEWLHYDRDLDMRNLVKNEYLAELTELRSLYFSAHSYLDTLSWLGSLNKLEHLQITVPVVPIEDGQLSDATNLKSITLIAHERLNTVESIKNATDELMELQQLTELTIVCYLRDRKIIRLGNRLKKNFPNTKIRFINRETWTPKLPDALTEHLKETKQRLSKQK